MSSFSGDLQSGGLLCYTVGADKEQNVIYIKRGNYKWNFTMLKYGVG